MFKEIEINGYRGLKNIRLKELERINVLIGENNSGKTSVLEAIQLFGSRNVIENTISIARKREAQFAATISAKLMPFDMLLYSFPINSNFSESHVDIMQRLGFLAASTTSPTTALAVGSLPAPLP